MLTALVEDLLRLPEVTVHTSWDSRLPPELPSAVKVSHVSTAEEEWSTFQQLVEECDATYIIAPEFSNILFTRCQHVRDKQKSLLNVTPEAVKLCTDKYQLWEVLVSIGIPTVDTELISDVAAYSPECYPFVVKPADGAGALSTFCVNSKTVWPAVRRHLLDDKEFTTYIAQPLIEGQPCSAIVYVGKTIEVFPVGVQKITIEDVIGYEGGAIPPLDAARQARFDPIVEQIVDVIPELVGLWGVDFIVPDSDPENPLVVEINPRLTTSYVGYRRQTDDNIAERLLFQYRRHPPLRWSKASVTFAPSGEVNVTNE